jgi:pyruvate kinase
MWSGDAAVMTLSDTDLGLGLAADIELDESDVVEALLTLRSSALDLEASCGAELDMVADADRPSAVNLLHYLALRQHDIRNLQRALAVSGLSSLGRAEAHVLATIDAVLARLGWGPRVGGDGGAATHESSRELLDRHTSMALGPLPAKDRVRLMVTLPTDAATDQLVVADLAEAGMDLARINCAHDDPSVWTAMAGAVRAEAARVGREIRVACDLAGPKLRTGPLPDGAPVVRARPHRGVDGNVQRPAQVRFTRTGEDREAAGDLVVVPVEGNLVDDAVVGDEIVLSDTRGRRRRFTVTRVVTGGIDATSDRTTYFAGGTALMRVRAGERLAVGLVGPLPASESFIRLLRHDRLRIRYGTEPGRPAQIGDDGAVTDPATISCELAAVFAAVEVGHRILIDDGTIEGVVDHVAADWFDVIIVRPQRAKLKAEKGINLPDTTLEMPALTVDDHAALAVVAPFADLVSLSFVGAVDDVVELRRTLDDLGYPDVAIGLKIEHAAAFRALPRLLLYGLQRPPMAVMVARGDLAIEIGFERLAEVQEQILWLCEAAHLPVIWATQVAESMAKHGIPTRAEVTDAASASRAECVMLNKGPHIADAIRFLDDIFERMHQHQDKRTGLLRRLSISDAFSSQ